MASPKYRDYFITINENASCYIDALEIVKELNNKLYALIVHDKDILRVKDENGEITETPKKVHKHIVVELNNPVSFNSIQNKFDGAHIEPIKYKKAAYQYLLHNSPNAKEKYQYAFEEIITNSPTSVKNAIECEEGIEIFKENMFLYYIAEGIRTPYQFTKRFGLNTYKQYWKSFSDMILELNKDETMQQDLDAIINEMREALPF